MNLLYLNLENYESSTETVVPESCWLWIADPAALSGRDLERVFMLSLDQRLVDVPAKNAEWAKQLLQQGLATSLQQAHKTVEGLLTGRLCADVPGRLLRHQKNQAHHPERDPLELERAAFAAQFSGERPLAGLRGFLEKNPRPHRLTASQQTRLRAAYEWLTRVISNEVPGA